MPMDEMLEFPRGYVKINKTHIKQQDEDMKRKELLEIHPYRIWQGKNGNWYTYFDSDGERKLKKRSTREGIEKFVIEYQKEMLAGDTVSDVFREWNDWKLENKKIVGSTHLRYEQDFAKYYGDFGKRRIRTVKPDEFIDFLERQIPKHNLSAKSFSNLKTITRGFLKRAKRRKLIDWNVDYMLTELEVSDRDYRKVFKEDYKEVYNEQETKAMMDYLIDNPDEKNLVLLLIFITGMRIGEAVTLKPEDIEQSCVHVKRTETRYKENGRYIYGVADHPKTSAGFRTVIVPKDYEWVLKKIRFLNPFGKWVFQNKSGNHLKEALVAARLRSICDNLHIYRKSPHKIRKTYVSMLMDEKVDNRMLIEQVGHSSITVSEMYYHRNRKSIERKQEILSGIEELRYKSNKGNSKNAVFKPKTGTPM